MKRYYWLTFSAAAVFGMMTLGGTLQAQDTTTQPSTPSQTQQPSDTQAPAPQQTAPAQTPDQSGRMPSSSSQPSADQSSGGTSEYIGTVVKQGDKYVFQDAASGQKYDIDHQDEVKKFEGKKVRVKGTLDPSTKMIHVQ